MLWLDLADRAAGPAVVAGRVVIHVNVFDVQESGVADGHDAAPAPAVAPEVDVEDAGLVGSVDAVLVERGVVEVEFCQTVLPVEAVVAKVAAVSWEGDDGCGCVSLMSWFRMCWVRGKQTSGC